MPYFRHTLALLWAALLALPPLLLVGSFGCAQSSTCTASVDRWVAFVGGEDGIALIFGFGLACYLFAGVLALYATALYAMHRNWSRP